MLTQLHKQLCIALEPTAVADVLKKFTGEQCRDFFQGYCHDFVRLVHKCHHDDPAHKNREYLVTAKCSLELALAQSNEMILYMYVVDKQCSEQLGHSHWKRVICRSHFASIYFRTPSCVP